MKELEARLMQAFVQTLLMSGGYTNETINAKSPELMQEVFQYWLDNPLPEHNYKALNHDTD